jgi:hypothetical protein
VLANEPSPGARGGEDLADAAPPVDEPRTPEREWGSYEGIRLRNVRTGSSF